MYVQYVAAPSVYNVSLILALTMIKANLFNHTCNSLTKDSISADVFNSLSSCSKLAYKLANCNQDPDLPN